MAFAGVDARSGQAADARPFGVPGTVEPLKFGEPFRPSEGIGHTVPIIALTSDRYSWDILIGEACPLPCVSQFHTINNPPSHRVFAGH